MAVKTGICFAIYCKFKVVQVGRYGADCFDDLASLDRSRSRFIQEFGHTHRKDFTAPTIRHQSDSGTAIIHATYSKQYQFVSEPPNAIESSIISAKE